MAEQNMWKKQMLANKSKTNDPLKPAETTAPNSSTPPWVKNNLSNTPALNNWGKNNSQTESATNNPPPWMKNNLPTGNHPPSPKVDPPKTTAGGASNVPAWMKPKEETATTNPAPWAKQGQDSSNSSPVKPNGSVSPGQNPPASQPAWMKTNNAQEPSPGPAWANKNTNSSPQPSWANKGAGQTAPNPPWMKTGDSSLPQNSNLQKAQKIADMEKEKKEMEEKQRLLEEEEKERKRQEKMKREKEEEENNIQRQLKAMQVEDDLSANCERQHKEQLERIEKEKKEREEREEREREEREREEREREEREREEREREAERAKLQKQRLQAEKREREREREQERVRLESQQKTRLQNERIQLEKLQKSKSRSGKKSRRALQSSKISHISSIRGAQHLQSSSLNAFDNLPPTERDPSLPENLFHKYTRLLNEECSEADYREKIALQRAIVQVQLQFKRESEGAILELIEKRKVTNRKRKIVFSNSMQIRYGLCEGRRGEDGVQFASEEGERLRNLFLYYEALTKCIVGLLKKKINTHFRVPLLNLAEHKGITFLLEFLCPELLDINETDVALFQEISNEVLILEKELELCYDARNDFLKPLTRNQLMVKKVSIYCEDYYVLYIKEDSLDGKPKKTETSPSRTASKLQTAIPNLTYLKLIEYITDEAVMLPFYTPPLLPAHQNYEFYEKIAPPACKHLIREITLANAINTVYSSCQGEVDENIFFSLILSENKEIWDMIRATGFASREVPSAIALSYLQKIAALRFAFTSAFFSRKQKSLIQAARPRVYIQKHEFQMLEFVKNLEKYIAEEKEELVEESMRMNRQLWEEVERSNASQEGSLHLLKVKREVSYLLFRGREGEAVELLEGCRGKTPPFAIENISLSLLFIKIFIKTDAEVPLLKKLSELLQILEFYFKEETIIHSYVYTIVGSYYSKKAGDPEREAKVITFYEHAINIALRLYGEKAQQVAEIYLSRANAMLGLERTEAFQRDMTCAVKIYKIHSKNNSKIAECNYLLGKVACLEGKRAEGVELMESSSALFLKMQNYVESLNVSFELLRFLEGEEGKYEVQIERIVEICFRHKSAWAFQRIVTLLLDRELHCYTALTIESLLEICAEEGERSREEAMIELEDEIKGFTSFIEIVRWALSILAAKALVRKEASSDYWKALNIMKDVIRFYAHLPSPPPLPSSPVKAMEAL